MVPTAIVFLSEYQKQLVNVWSKLGTLDRQYDLDIGIIEMAQMGPKSEKVGELLFPLKHNRSRSSHTFSLFEPTVPALLISC